MKSLYKPLIAVLIGMAIGADGMAAAPPNQSSSGNPAPAPTGGTGLAGPAVVSTCEVGTSRAELNINNVRALMLNGGDMWWDLSGVARYEVPKVNDPTQPRRTALFAGAVWIGGQDPIAGTPVVVAQTYRQNSQRSFWPGPIDTISGITTQARCLEWNRHFECTKNEVLQFISDWEAGRIRSIDDVPERIKFWPSRNNQNLLQLPSRPITDPSKANAPFIDLNRDGSYDPVDGDYPRLPGDQRFLPGKVNPSHFTSGLATAQSGADQVIFWVTNDVGNRKTFGGGSSPEVGFEFTTEAFGYITTDSRNDMTFYRQRIINKGQRLLEQTYFGQWADPDLGFAYDDYVGCNVPLGLGYCYNGDDLDQGITGYGANPPSIGIDYFRGPIADPFDGIDNDKDYDPNVASCNTIYTGDPATAVRSGYTRLCGIDEPGEEIIVSNFLYFDNNSNPKNGNPSFAVEYYNFLRNMWRDNTDVSYDLQKGLSTVGSVVGGRVVPKATFMFPDDTDQEVCYGAGFDRRNPCNTNPGNTPVVQPRWTERTATDNDPGDRRFVLSGGPFTLRPGAFNELTIGVVWARASSGGATGSLNRLFDADRAAQALFDRDFEILVGPPEPIVDITELDGELVMTLTPSPSLNGRNTETYTVFDPANQINYNFEGYIVYQLADDRVSNQELNNPDRARIIAQSDIRNNITTLYNLEFNQELGEQVRTLKVQGANQGLQNAIRINRDLFNSERPRLINFKKYYFRVVAYAAPTKELPLNENPSPFLFGTPRPDNLGRPIFVISGTPHKIETERGGSQLASSFGQEFDLTRIYGVGNGGRILSSLPAEQEAQILGNSFKREITYAKGGGPVEIKVYNPKIIKSGNFNLEISSRVRLLRTNANTARYKVGDTIVAQLNVPAAQPTRPSNAIWTPITTTVVQNNGIGVVQRVLPVNDSITDYDVKVFNEDRGGNFTLRIDTVSVTNSNPTFVKYDERPVNVFRWERNSTRPNGIVTDSSARSVTHVRGDYWKLTELNSNTVIQSKLPSSEGGEQIIPEYGISVKVSNAPNPGEFIQANRGGGFQRAEIVHSDPSQVWLSGVSTSLSPWLIRSTDIGYDTWAQVDPAEIYLNVLDGSWAPLYASKPALSGGAGTTQFLSLPAVGAFGQPNYNTRITNAPYEQLNGLQNVDIVFTNDRSKWTRCVVLQVDSINSTGSGDDFAMHKSRQLSIDINGNQTGGLSPVSGLQLGTTAGNNGVRISRGMGWFPGYAVDVERGERLNIMFSESALLGLNGSNTLYTNNRGNDLKFDLNILERGNFTNRRSYVYVTRTRYDEGRILEAAFDSIAYWRTGTTGAPLPSVTYRASVNHLFRRFVTWVGNPLVAGSEAIAYRTDARVRLRVNRSFSAYDPERTTRQSGINNQLANNLFLNPAPVPTYQFTTNGLEVVRNSAAVAASACDLIRVVPNPYYATSGYENTQVETTVKIVNIPARCKISIYNLSGSLVKSFNVDRTTLPGSNQDTFIDWDLKNDLGIPVASGAYLIYVDGGNTCQKVVKFYGITRPLDLNGANN